MWTRLFLLTVAMIMPQTMAADPIPCKIDPLLNTPDNWQMTPDDFELTFSLGSNRLYTWLTSDRTRAKISPALYRNTTIELTAFEDKIPVQEVIADFSDDRLNLVTVSFYNRGDNGDIAGEVLKQRFTSIGRAMNQALDARPQKRSANASSGLLTEGYSWYSQQRGSALLEHNEDALAGGQPEFLRLRLARPKAFGALAASMLHSRGGAAMRLSELPKFVMKNEAGDTYVSNLPMVDQGSKGYCVAASVQRLFEHYGIGADMHQIAQVAESDPKRGTNVLLMAKELDQIDYRFKTRLEIIGLGKPMTEAKKNRGEYFIGKPVEEKDFLKAIQDNVGDGLPLLWSLEIGRFPENPPLKIQTGGGHMRIIIGYNDKTNEVLFSDSWGFGHELKRMNMSHAYQASHGLFVLKPTVR